MPKMEFKISHILVSPNPFPRVCTPPQNAYSVGFEYHRGQVALVTKGTEVMVPKPGFESHFAIN